MIYTLILYSRCLKRHTRNKRSNQYVPFPFVSFQSCFYIINSSFSVFAYYGFLIEAIPPAYNHSRPSHALNFTFTLPWKRCLETREGSYACLFDRSLFFVIIIISLFLLPALSFSYVTFPLRGSHVSPAFVGRSYRGIFISYC